MQSMDRIHFSLHITMRSRNALLLLFNFIKVIFLVLVQFQVAPIFWASSTLQFVSSNAYISFSCKLLSSCMKIWFHQIHQNIIINKRRRSTTFLILKLAIHKENSECARKWSEKFRLIDFENLNLKYFSQIINLFILDQQTFILFAYEL